MRPTHIRDNTMKRFLLFALVALFIGGFTSNANAQFLKKSSKDGKAKVEVVKKENWNNVIKEYELAVEKAVKLYKAMNDKAATPKVDPKEFDVSFNKAMNLKTKIEKAKDQLNRTQVRRYNKASAKLNQILTKG